MFFETAYPLPPDRALGRPLRIYTGILGQVGDIVAFTSVARRLKELFPRCELTFAVSARYREAGELVAGLPYVDRLFVTELYFERLTAARSELWHYGWPVDLRGPDERSEQQLHDLVFETRPRHRRVEWWKQAHLVEELAHQIGVPGPIDLRTEVAIPPKTVIPDGTAGKIVIHNDPALSPAKQWPWPHLQHFARLIGPEQIVLLGGPGPPLPSVIDLRGRTSLAQAAAIIAASKCFVGIDSGLMWIAGSLQVTAVGLYGTAYFPAYGAIHPRNPNAVYLQVNGPMDLIQPVDVATAVEQAIASGRTRRSSPPNPS